MPRYFVTGASGFIGSAVVTELLQNGHQVLGLARSEASAASVRALGGEPVRGDLENLDVLSKTAAASDGVLHLGFVHDFSNFERCCAIDQAAIKVFGEALAGSNKPLVIATGTLSVAGHNPADESTAPDRDHPPFSLRVIAEDMAQDIAKKGVRASVVRLAPTVHGKGDKGFIDFIAKSGKAGKLVLPAPGTARWPAVHREDAATAWRLAAEKGTPGAVYHAVAEEAVPVKDIVEAIGKKMNVPVVQVSPEEAGKSLGFMAFPLQTDDPTSSARTRKELGWTPKQVGVVADIEANYEF